MSTKTEPLILTPTKCKLCGYVFPVEMFHQATVLGLTPEAKVGQIMKAVEPLKEHLAKFHNHPVRDWKRIDRDKSLVALVEMQVDQYRGWLLLDAFETSEPVFLEQREMARAAIHRKTARAHVSDERLKERLEQVWKDCVLAVDREPFDGCLALLKQLRNALEERTPHPINAVPADPQRAATPVPHETETT